jgi:hypothetical protein
MSEAPAISLLVFGHSDAQNVAVFRKSFLERAFLGRETQVSDKKSAGVSGLGLLEILTFFPILGLFDVQPTAHVLGFVVLKRQVQTFLIVEFHESHSFGSAGVAVGQQIHGFHSRESVEVRFDVFLGSVVRKS